MLKDVIADGLVTRSFTHLHTHTHRQMLCLQRILLLETGLRKTVCACVKRNRWLRGWLKIAYLRSLKSGRVYTSNLKPATQAHINPEQLVWPWTMEASYLKHQGEVGFVDWCGVLWSTIWKCHIPDQSQEEEEEEHSIFCCLWKPCWQKNIPHPETIYAHLAWSTRRMNCFIDYSKESSQQILSEITRSQISRKSSFFWNFNEYW